MTIDELIKKYKKQLDTHWDASFYKEDLDSQERKLLQWSMEAMRAQSNPKLDTKYWEREEVFCAMQLHRVYQKQKEVDELRKTKGKVQTL